MKTKLFFAAAIVALGFCSQSMSKDIQESSVCVMTNASSDAASYDKILVGPGECEHEVANVLMDGNCVSRMKKVAQQKPRCVVITLPLDITEKLSQAAVHLMNDLNHLGIASTTVPAGTPVYVLIPSE